jgi:RNA polymerase sigma-70 factor (ECF subfamily)
MDDNQILALYASGDDRAAAESEAQYGGLCARVARNILDNSHEADVCVHDALTDARPPKDTKKLSIFLAKATRELALARFKAKLSAKRGDSHYQSTLDELNECVPAGSTGFGSGFDDDTEAARLGASVNRFLRKQRAEVRDIFVCRYFYGDSIGEITRRFGLSERSVTNMLRRARTSLRKHLEKEGVRL